MPEPTNLIVFLGENHGRHVTGAYGHPMVQSPNIDWIANTGTWFNNAYCSSPICCPARASVATGRYPHQTGYWENAIPYDGRVPTWMHRLREVGHEITAIGKLHFRSTKDDNGFREEILPMHIVDGVGQVVGLLRGTGEEQVRPGVWEMYVENLGAGETSYHVYDREITAAAIDWLKDHAAKADKPWVLCVHYGSAHPPFKAPQELLDLYPVDQVPLPVCWRPDERPDHPAVAHLRHILGTHETLDENTLRRIVAGYFALITHLDAQVGQVLSAADDLGLLSDARVLYSSDHGDSCGNHYIFGKFNMYERSVGVPYMMCGPEIPAGHVVNQITSHVDLFPTLLESMGVSLEAADQDLPGIPYGRQCRVPRRIARALSSTTRWVPGTRVSSFARETTNSSIMSICRASCSTLPMIPKRPEIWQRMMRARRLWIDLKPLFAKCSIPKKPTVGASAISNFWQRGSEARKR